MELEKAPIPTTEDEQNLIGSAVQNAEGVIKEQLDAKSGPIQYLLQPREKLDEQSDKLVSRHTRNTRHMSSRKLTVTQSNALNPQTLQQQTDAMADEGFFEQNGDEYLGLDD